MKITQDMKQTPNWSKLIKKRRDELHETQKEFGDRFGVTGATVSHWESGATEAPYDVTWWLMQHKLRATRK